MNIIVSIIIGALAGFLAGKIMKGSGFGFIVNLIVGIVGGFIATYCRGLALAGAAHSSVHL